jgi:hypothetical protein
MDSTKHLPPLTTVTPGNNLTSPNKSTSTPQITVRPQNQSVVKRQPSLSFDASNRFSSFDSKRRASSSSLNIQQIPDSGGTPWLDVKSQTYGNLNSDRIFNSSSFGFNPKPNNNIFNSTGNNGNNSTDRVPPYNLDFSNDRVNDFFDSDNISINNDANRIEIDIDDSDRITTPLSPVAQQYDTILGHLLGMRPDSQLLAKIGEKPITGKSLVKAVKSFNSDASVTAETMSLEKSLYKKVEKYSKVLLHFPDESPPRVDVYYRNDKNEWFTDDTGNPSGKVKCESPVKALEKIGQDNKDCKAEVVSVKWKKVEPKENKFGFLNSWSTTKKKNKEDSSGKPPFSSTLTTLKSTQSRSPLTNNPFVPTITDKSVRVQKLPNSSKPTTTENKNTNKLSFPSFNISKLKKQKLDDPFEIKSINKAVMQRVENLASKAGEELDKKDYLSACDSYLRATDKDNMDAPENADVKQALLKLAGHAADLHLKETRSATTPGRYLLYLGLEKMNRVYERFSGMSASSSQQEKKLYEIRKEMLKVMTELVTDSKATKPNDAYDSLCDASLKFSESCVNAVPPVYDEALIALDGTLETLAKANRAGKKEYAEVLRQKAYVMHSEHGSTSTSDRLRAQANAIYRDLGLPVNEDEIEEEDVTNQARTDEPTMENLETVVEQPPVDPQINSTVDSADQQEQEQGKTNPLSNLIFDTPNTNIADDDTKETTKQTETVSQVLPTAAASTIENTPVEKAPVENALLITVKSPGKGNGKDPE